MLQGCVIAGNSARMASIALAGFMGSSVGLRDISRDPIPCTTRLVVVSANRLCLRSTSRPKWRRKSAPRIGVVVSATTKTQRNMRRSPRLSVRERVPNV